LTRLVAMMETYQPETRNAFEGSLAWLNQWAVSRSFGLGSKLPWDAQVLVESLSDSTVYMAYYTIAHFLQGTSFIFFLETSVVNGTVGGVMDGSKVGPLGVVPEQMTDEVFDYIFTNKPWPKDASLPREKADVMKREFEYFYPFDIRSSGKDLVPNHLTFAVYVHTALFGEAHWPRSIRTNGHLLLNGEKMSKSKGNFLTMHDAVQKFGADATRLSLADAGDSVEDANFDEKTANANILRLHTLVGWCEVRHSPPL
jgi:leucyl-tRNA synthetase